MTTKQGADKHLSELALSITLGQGGEEAKGDVEKIHDATSNMTVDDLFFHMEDEASLSPKSKKSNMKLMQKLVSYSLNIVGRWLSLTDMATDAILFYRATVYGKREALPLTVVLFTSMCDCAIYLIVFIRREIVFISRHIGRIARVLSHFVVIILTAHQI
eukprot:450142_1